MNHPRLRVHAARCSSLRHALLLRQPTPARLFGRLRVGRHRFLLRIYSAAGAASTAAFRDQKLSTAT